MTFEYDPDKSARNKAKHGLDFDEVQELWSDPHMIAAPARTEDELRWLAVAKINGKHWTVIYSLRDEAIRLISARRSRNTEIEAYESA